MEGIRSGPLCTFERDSIFHCDEISVLYVPGPGLSLVVPCSQLNLVEQLLKPPGSLEEVKKVWYLLGMDPVVEGEFLHPVAVNF